MKPFVPEKNCFWYGECCFALAIVLLYLPTFGFELMLLDYTSYTAKLLEKVQ